MLRRPGQLQVDLGCTVEAAEDREGEEEEEGIRDKDEVRMGKLDKVEERMGKVERGMGKAVEGMGKAVEGMGKAVEGRGKASHRMSKFLERVKWSDREEEQARKERKIP